MRLAVRCQPSLCTRQDDAREMVVVGWGDGGLVARSTASVLPLLLHASAVAAAAAPCTATASIVAATAAVASTARVAQTS
jgi:hypothetical protein